MTFCQDIGQDIEVLLNSPDIPQYLTPFDFYLLGTLKVVVYRRKPPTLTALKEEIETSCRAIPLDTLVNVVHAVVRRKSSV